MSEVANLKTIETLDRSPFKYMVATIGNLPTSFVDSMSYYECIAWLVKYLETEVMPTVNNNAEAVAELQAAYIQLKEFVDNYFDNLDVQEEINNKLDEMVEDGVIKSILNNELLSEINGKVLQNTLDIDANTEALDGKVSQGEAGSITMEMLAQDVRESMTGGSTAVVGTDSVGIANIVNKAVDVYKLDDVLQASVYIDYGDTVAIGNKQNGICRENSSTHKIEIVSPTSTDYGWYKVALTKGKSYTFTGYYYGPIGFMIADNNDNVIVNENPDPTTYGAPKAYSNVFTVKQDNLYAFIGVKTEFELGQSNLRWFFQANCPLLRTINKVVNKFENLEPLLLNKVEGYCATVASVNVTNYPALFDNAECNTLIYQMTEGVKYKVSASAWYSTVGIMLLALNDTYIYRSNSDEYSGFRDYEYTFTASVDGYIVVHEYPQRGHAPSVEIIPDITTSVGSGESITFDKWYALGDSLTEVNFRASENYVGYITDELNITTVNLGHSGAGYYRTNNNSQNFRTEVSEISGYNYNTDIITIMGSINDYSQIDNNLGQLGDTTTDTIYGCMYTFFSLLQTAYMGARVGAITMPPCYNNRADFMTKARLYNKALKETAELFDVPVLDLTESCNLKPWEENFRNEFYSADGVGGSGQVDNVHPNSKGHWLIHSKIKEFLKTL